jgi:hypothetical protein
MARKSPFKFYNEKDFGVDHAFLKTYMEDDNQFTVRLFRVDMVQSKTSDIYGTSYPEDKVFLAPLELPVLLNIGDAQTESWDNASIAKANYSSFAFRVLISELETRKININIGDFFTYNDGKEIRAFEITTVSNISTNNTLNGFKPVDIEVTGILAKDDVFPQEYKY